jgi:N-methylhydantoinase A
MTLPLDQLPILSEERPGKSNDREIELYINRGWQKGRLAGQASLAAGAPLAGPALLEDPTSTLFLPQGWEAVRDEHHNTIMTRI